MILHLEAWPDSQRYPLNLHLRNNDEDIVVFINITSYNFLRCLFTFKENLQLKIMKFQLEKNISLVFDQIKV